MKDLTRRRFLANGSIGVALAGVAAFVPVQPARSWRTSETSPRARSRFSSARTDLSSVTPSSPCACTRRRGRDDLGVR